MGWEQICLVKVGRELYFIGWEQEFCVKVRE